MCGGSSDENLTSAVPRLHSILEVPPVYHAKLELSAASAERSARRWKSGRKEKEKRGKRRAVIASIQSQLSVPVPPLHVGFLRKLLIRDLSPDQTNARPACCLHARAKGARNN